MKINNKNSINPVSQAVKNKKKLAMYKMNYDKLKRDLDAYARASGISQKECYLKVGISDNGLRNAVKKGNLGIKYLVNISNIIKTPPAHYFFRDYEQKEETMSVGEAKPDYENVDRKISQLIGLLENCESRRNELEKENQELRNRTKK